MKKEWRNIDKELESKNKAILFCKEYMWIVYPKCYDKRIYNYVKVANMIQNAYDRSFEYDFEKDNVYWGDNIITDTGIVDIFYDQLSENKLFDGDKCVVADALQLIAYRVKWCELKIKYNINLEDINT